jgi:oxygen-independent coproporphyrinogen-3 oxidase
VTLEVNPGSYRDGYFPALRALGINRLSIGVQSFDDRQLQALGRVHDAATARRTVAAARAAGFEAYNVDLMFGLPGQDRRAALADLEAALALGPEHLSLYQLTIEPGTRFATHPPTLPPEDAIEEAQEACHALLAAQGFLHYEVSGFARPGRESRHNLNYWQFGDYLGIGAGAHGKLSMHEGIERRRRVHAPRAYLATAGSAAAVAQTERVERDALVLEFLLNALRLRDGFTVERFEARTGMAWSGLAEKVSQAIDLGLLECRGEQVRATPRGWKLLDTLLLQLAGD